MLRQRYVEQTRRSAYALPHDAARRAPRSCASCCPTLCETRSSFVCSWHSRCLLSLCSEQAKLVALVEAHAAETAATAAAHAAELTSAAAASEAAQQSATASAGQVGSSGRMSCNGSRLNVSAYGMQSLHYACADCGYADDGLCQAATTIAALEAEVRVLRGHTTYGSTTHRVHHPLLRTTS